MRGWAPHRALPDESSLVEFLDFDDSGSTARPYPPRSGGSTRSRHATRSPRSLRWTVLLPGAGTALVASFLAGRVSVDDASAHTGCDRPAYRSHLVVDTAHPDPDPTDHADALAALRRRLPDFTILGAERAVYVDTLQLCRSEIRAADGAGDQLQITVALGPAPTRQGSAPIPTAVTVQPLGVGARTELTYRTVAGLVVTVQVVAKSAGAAPGLPALLDLLADPELSA